MLFINFHAILAKIGQKKKATWTPCLAVEMESSNTITIYSEMIFKIIEINTLLWNGLLEDCKIDQIKNL